MTSRPNFHPTLSL